MKLYGLPRSGHAHTVRNMLSMLGLEYESVVVDTSKKEQFEASFLAINPFGKIPVLDDDGVIVRDSHAILVYLAKKYDESNRWLPDDPEGGARVQEWLATSTLDLVVSIAWSRAGLNFGRAIDVPAAQKRAKRLLDAMDAHLAEREWLAADHATIADVSMYTYVRVAHEGEIDTSGYTNVVAWMGRVEALPGHEPMTSLRG